MITSEVNTMGKNDKKSSKFLVKTKKNMIKLQAKVKSLKKNYFGGLEAKHLVIIAMLALGSAYGVYWYFFNFDSSEDLDREELKVEIRERLKQEELNEATEQYLAKEEAKESTTESNQKDSADVFADEAIDRGSGEISEAKESRPSLESKQEQEKKQKDSALVETEDETGRNKEEIVEVGGKGEDFLLPVDGEKTNANQWYKDEVLKVWRFNPGLDIKAAAGSEVIAAAAGEVEEVKEDDYFGTKVIIRHHSGLKTVYFNLTDVKLKVGNKVARGEKIALLKDNDYYQENMLRFKIKQDSSYLEPEDYFSL